MFRAAAAVIVIAGLGAAAAWAQAPSPAPISAPTVIQRDCVGCHDIGMAAGKGRTPKDWSDVIDRMVDHGLTEDDAELAAVKAYLAKALPPGAQGVPKDLQTGS